MTFSAKAYDHMLGKLLSHEVRPGESTETAPTALRAHTGDWREALRIYRDWTHSWYAPQAPRKPWFRSASYYQQVYARSQLLDPETRGDGVATLCRAQPGAAS